MNYVHEQLTHEEINLARLLRRLEKSVASPEEWNSNNASVDVLLKVHKTSQKVKFARRMIKTTEIECEDTQERSKRLTDSKVRLDRIETFLKHTEKSSQREPVKSESLLAKLPIPKLIVPPKEQPLFPPEARVANDAHPVPASEPERIGTALSEQKPLLLTKNLSIVPPDPAEISPSLISTALPSLLPINPSETARASAFNRSLGPTPIFRATGNQATTVLHDELSSQLEQMAQQLKRNAIHFSTSLAKDKAFLEDAAQKIESNFDTMQSQRLKLRDRSSQSRSNTWLVIGIILLVVLLFTLMVVVIRFF